ncbi:hypothetical protein C1882_18185 [Pseudomonas sp. FW305-E2]|nr:hypothetical protein C1882_18185 [Pseudomonas sp. FW305-E2]
MLTRRYDRPVTIVIRSAGAGRSIRKRDRDLIAWIRTAAANGYRAILVWSDVIHDWLPRLWSRTNTNIAWIEIWIIRNIGKLDLPITIVVRTAGASLPTRQRHLDIITRGCSTTSDYRATTFSRLHFARFRSRRSNRRRHLVNNQVRCSRHRRQRTR